MTADEYLNLADQYLDTAGTQVADTELNLKFARIYSSMALAAAIRDGEAK